MRQAGFVVHLARRRWLCIVATVCEATIASGQTLAADTPAPSRAVHRMIHVCDCSPEYATNERAALLEAFAKRGYVQGRNLDLVTYDVTVIGTEAPERGPLSSRPKDAFDKAYVDFLSRQMSGRGLQLILASGIRVAQGAKETSRQTPVIFWRLTDPVGFGLVQSLAQPAGNLTGFSRAIEKLTVKRLELLHEMLPRARRIGFVSIEDYDYHRQQAADVRRAGESLGLTVASYALPVSDWTPDRLDAVFARMRQDGIEAFLLPDVNAQPQLLVQLCAKHRLPTIHSLPHAVTDWVGLAAYSTAAPDELGAVVDYAARILRGDKPRELPVQEPTQYELVLNMKTAREIGITFPTTFKLRATSVVDK